MAAEAIAATAALPQQSAADLDPEGAYAEGAYASPTEDEPDDLFVQVPRRPKPCLAPAHPSSHKHARCAGGCLPRLAARRCWTFPPARQRSYVIKTLRSNWLEWRKPTSSPEQAMVCAGGALSTRTSVMSSRVAWSDRPLTYSRRVLHA